MSQAAEQTEVLVIGGGVIGSSIAYHLARQGRAVLIVERDEVAVEPAASWASAGGVRRQVQEPAEAPLASEASARWPTLAEELDADPQYRQGGSLLLAETEAEAEHLQTLVRAQHALGFADVRLVDREEVFRLVSDLGEQVIAGSFSPADGQANPVLTTRAFATAATRHGARYWTGTPCLGLERVGDRVVGARTARGTVRAEHTVLAAGAWSGALAGSVGLQVPMHVCVLQALLSTPAPLGVLRPVLHAVGRSLSLKQLPGGEFLLGGGWPGDPTSDHRGYTLRPERQRGNWETACELFPPVREQRLARAWGGLQAHTFDDLPYIGSVSGLGGLTLAFGSWQGFALAPAIGRSVAGHLAGRPTPELDRFTPDRVARFDPAQVAAFLAQTAE